MKGIDDDIRSGITWYDYIMHFHGQVISVANHIPESLQDKVANCKHMSMEKTVCVLKPKQQKRGLQTQLENF